MESGVGRVKLVKPIRKKWNADASRRGNFRADFADFTQVRESPMKNCP